MALARLLLRDRALWLRGSTEPISWLWLRDACQCPRCVHPSTRQKLHRSSDIPSDLQPLGPVSLDHAGATIAWSPEHTSVYPISYLNQLAGPVAAPVQRIPWITSSLHARSEALWTPYSNIYDDKRACLKFIDQLLKFGIAFLSEVPVGQTDNQSCELRRLGGHISRIRTTFYGPLWDVKSVPNSKNVAYTDLNLDLHMDLL
jgi:gamma-butyrobetaine dioxygenase